MKGPLTGITVIELGTMIAVPAATHLLASYGADVIKVEDTEAGDPLRFYGSRKNGLSGWFANANAGKRSIALQLKSDAGREIFEKLLNHADVLIEGFRPGVMTRLGLGYESLAKRYPRLIYCSSSGFGASGPYADRPAYDPLIQAMSGWAVSRRDEDPQLIRSVVADKVGANNNAQAIMAALIQRGVTGRGCEVKTNMLDANLAFVWPDMMMHCTLRDAEGVEHHPNILHSYRLLRAADGWVTVAIGTDKQWLAACAALDQPDLAEDPRFASAVDRSANGAAWYEAQEAMTAKYTGAEVVRRLLDADVPAAAALAPEQVYEDAHVQQTETVRESQHPVMGRYLHPRSRASQLGEDLTLRPAPLLGQHSREILQELGETDAQVNALAEQGIVRM